MKRAPFVLLLAGALSLLGCPAPDAQVSPAQPATPPSATAEPATPESATPESGKTPDVATLPEVTYYALGG